MEDLIEAYLSVYEESDIKARAKAAVDHQRHGTHGDDDAQKSTQRSVDRLKTMPKVTRSSAALAAKRVESDVKKSNAYAPQRQKPGTIGAYRMEQVDLYDLVLDHLLDEGYAETEENAITIMANMSEEWIDEIIDEAADNVIMTVKSPSGQERSKIYKGASRPSDSHRHENPEQIANRRFSQQLSDRNKEREERMRAGRLTVATKRGIEAATNKSDREVPTDYRARRRRASGR